MEINNREKETLPILVKTLGLIFTRGCGYILMIGAMGYNFWLVLDIAFSMAFWAFVFELEKDRRIIKERMDS